VEGGGDSKKGKKERRKIGGLVEWENRKKGKWRAKQKNIKKKRKCSSQLVCVFGDRLDLEVVKGERVEDEQLTSGDRRAVKKRGRKWEGRIK